MTVYYFNDERTGYCEGPKEDQEKFHPNAFFVERIPGPEYWYNFEKKQWEMIESLFKDCHELRLRNFLIATSWLLNFEDSPLSNTEKQTLREVRHECMHFFEGDFMNKKLPHFPEFINKWVKN